MPKGKPPKAANVFVADPMVSAEAILRDIRRLVDEVQPTSAEELDALLQQAMSPGPIRRCAPETPLEEAQDLAYAAAAEPTAKRRIELAKRALAISPDCADAYGLLADEASTASEARDLFAEGVAAGKRALGADWDRLTAAHHLWLSVDGRPYMRARAGLANANWECGDRQAAIEQGWEMLELNPGDNQGVRYTLLGWLLLAGSISAIDRLLSEYPGDPSATWLYSRALHEFRMHSASSEANSKLKVALRANPHVPPYLLGHLPLPADRPEYVGFGDEAEAVAYTFDCGVVWADTAGALEWLSRQSVARARPRDRQRKRRR